MKIEDFYGKFILRMGDLVPMEVNEQTCEQYGMTLKFLARTESEGLLFNCDSDAYLHRKSMMTAAKKSGRLSKDLARNRIYISGGIDHLNYEERYKAFEEVEKRLREEGWIPFNPMKNGLPRDAPSCAHMRRDLAELNRLDHPYSAIYMMRRWTHSLGCRTEFNNATAIGLDIIFEEGAQAIKFE